MKLARISFFSGKSRSAAIVPVLILSLLLAACNKDEEITVDAGAKPVIKLDSPTGIYSVKTGRELTISPDYESVTDAAFSWIIGGKLVSKEPTLTYKWDKPGDVYIDLRVETGNGSAAEELKVEVAELLPPAINLYAPAGGFKVLKGKDLSLKPEFVNRELDGFGIEWSLDGRTVSTDTAYTFSENVTGVYQVTVKAVNEDGEATKTIEVEVVDRMPCTASFPKAYLGAASTTRYTFVGRKVWLRPQLVYFTNPVFKWTVDGKVATDATGREFGFKPEKPGDYEVTVTVTDGDSGATAEASVTVTCVPGNESSVFRPATGGSSAYSTRVFEYMPAPGQFINETIGGGEAITTAEEAVEYAAKRLESRQYLSLGAFGGYVIVGFDHSISNSGGYDFLIQGNAFDTSNEPGIVWVMQDVNGNGLPDDEWYELKGSETGKSTTLQDYEVTYYRPASPRSDTYWTDNYGNSGRVEINAHHSQDFYYPLWAEGDSYVLTGTRLAQRSSQNPDTGLLQNSPFDWGYADNSGSDRMGSDTPDGSEQLTGFKISNAMSRDGKPAGLEFIDFIKVQSGVQGTNGFLGEVSTEVLSFKDNNMKQSF